MFMVMFFTLLLMGAGLSMDAFAVSICKGVSKRKIAFILLGFIGGKMVVEAIREKDEAVEVRKMDPPLDLKEMFIWQSQPASMPLPLESHLHFCRCQSLRQFPSSELRPL